MAAAARSMSQCPARSGTAHFTAGSTDCISPRSKARFEYFGLPRVDKAVTSANELVAVSSLHFAERAQQATTSVVHARQIDVEQNGENVDLANEVRAIKED